MKIQDLKTKDDQLRYLLAVHSTIILKLSSLKDTIELCDKNSSVINRFFNKLFNEILKGEIFNKDYEEQKEYDLSTLIRTFDKIENIFKKK